ncbi:MAG: NUDIX hydrolase [Candidatus Nanopelagicales bacterium]|jgi:8-oxo-dGTP diphosphatase|nr:NUDIX hydrolase [Candidatus Nanopelagicales bacterium]
MSTVTKHLEGEHNQLDHAPDRAAAMRDWLSNVVGPFFFNQSKGKHAAKPPALNWWSVFDDQMEAAKEDRTKLRGPIKIGDKGAYFVPMSTDDGAGDGYFYTSSGQRLWGRYGAAGVMIRSRNADGVPVYLLAKRSASISGGGGTWAVPGGAIDRDETPGDGAKRELAEEVGDVPGHLNYKVVAEDRNELEDGWAYTTVLAEVDKPFNVEAKDWETVKGGWGWFTEGQIKQMTLHPAMRDRMNVLWALWKQHKGGAHAAVDKHLPGLHNQKSHGGSGTAPWILDGGGFLNENEWAMHKWAYAYNIDNYKNDYDQWHLGAFGKAYLPWDAPDDKITQPKGAPDPDPPDPVTVADNVDDWVDQLMAGAAETKVPAKPAAEESGVPGLTILDKRKDPKGSPLTYTPHRLANIYPLVGIPEQAKVQLEIRDAKPGLPYGSTMRTGKDTFTVRINLKPLSEASPGSSNYPEAALYVINNTLVHEMRHVGQHYAYPDMDKQYSAEMADKGYSGNFFEKEAWLYGHYADQTSTKSWESEYEGKPITLPLAPDGFSPYDVWAFHPPGWQPPEGQN